MSEKDKIIFDSAVSKYKTKFELVMKSKISNDFKSCLLSKIARKQGNLLYLKEKHDYEMHLDIFRLYSKSIAFAPIESEELALAYGNRSAFLLHINKYNETIQDINRVLKITKSKILKIKLYSRKIQCLNALKLHEEVEESITEAKILIEQIQQESNEKLVFDLMDKVEFTLGKAEHIISSKEPQHDILKNLPEEETTGIPSTVAINYNQNYGRHLVATCDFQPGDIIFTEKLYAKVLHPENYYSHCYLCLKASWSLIPCDNCNWAMFCSAQCKKKAEEKFHDMECLPVSVIKTEYGEVLQTFHICMRLFVIGLKEAGSIMKLKSDLKSVVKLQDTIFQGFMNDGKVERNFKAVCTLQEEIISNETLLEFFNYSTIFLICLVNSSSNYFGNIFKINEIQDLFSNDFIFFNLLLAKLYKITQLNCFSLQDKYLSCDSNISNNEIFQNFENDQRGCCLGLLTSLLSHSCVPNANRCFTENGEIILYALQPIKKNSQIFNSYGWTFYDTPDKTDRQKRADRYQFTCQCQACTMNWIIKNDRSINYGGVWIPISIDEEKFVTHHEHLFQLFELVPSENQEINQRSIDAVKDLIINAVKLFPESSTLIGLMKDILIVIIENKYGFQDALFSQCKKM